MRHFLTAFLSLFLLVGVAHAGQVTVLDNAGTIPQEQAARLRAEGSRWNFNLKVFTGVFASKRALEQSTHECIVTPNDVCVGVDPIHHGTRVNFGTGTGVRPADFNFIAGSGNSFLRTGDYLGAVESIADRATESAKASSQTVRVQVTAPPPVVVNQTGPSETHWFLWTLFFLGVGGCIWWIIARVSRQEKIAASLREERDEYLDANVDRMTAPTPTPRPRQRSAPQARTVSPAPAPVAPTTVVVHDRGGSGGNDLLTGVVLGEMLSRPSPSVSTHEVVHERVVEREAPAPSYSSRSSDDGGGGGSSWGGSSSSDDSSSSSDSGGGSSDFGGGDSGGGGSDGGGGGGDW